MKNVENESEKRRERVTDGQTARKERERGMKKRSNRKKKRSKNLQRFDSMF
jgi:hypothetical protein